MKQTEIMYKIKINSSNNFFRDVIADITCITTNK